MGYEIDFLPVGEGKRNGDAILTRWGNLSGSRNDQTIVLVDGGLKETAEKVMEHLESYYRTNRIDLVVSTHPDADHINGLIEVVQQLEVGTLWMHQPWNHRVGKFRSNLPQSLESASELEQIARHKRIQILEPFVGNHYSDSRVFIRVIGPTAEYYEELLPAFEESQGHSYIRQSVVDENWYKETLDNTGETTAKNNSSVILDFQYNGERPSYIFTGDAGIPALKHAADVLSRMDRLGRTKFIQVPHHGSKRNVGPAILNCLLGSIVNQNERRGIAFVSCAPKGKPKHPHKKVTNAFRRRGYPVIQTAGIGIVYQYNAPPRQRWATAQPLPLYYKVEDD